MTVRFLIDEDVDPAVVRGLRLRAPGIDILDVKCVGLQGTTDVALLELAHAQNRLLVTHDRRTMTRHFRERLASGKGCTGVCILSRKAAIGDLIETLLLVWAASSAGEWRDRIEYIG